MGEINYFIGLAMSWERSRLYPLTKETPKPLLTLVISILEHVLILEHAGVQKSVDGRPFEQRFLTRKNQRDIYQFLSKIAPRYRSPY